MNINKNIKFLLVQQHIKQLQMCFDLKMNPSRLSGIINGWIEPKPDEQEKIANYFNVKPAALFAKEANTKSANNEE